MLYLYPLMELYDMNTLMKKTVIGSALLLMVSASQAADVANAQPQPLTRPGALFSQADADQDGKLSAEEFAQLQKLHEAEMAKRQAARPGFTSLDKDGDGYVTQEEMRAAMKSHRGGQHGRGMGCAGAEKASFFSQADADQNGTLSAEEYQQLLTLRQEHQARMNATTPNFKTLDSNGDGQLSHDELRNGMHQQMQKINAQPTTK